MGKTNGYTATTPPHPSRVLIAAIVIGFILMISASSVVIASLILRPHDPEFRVDSFSISNLTVGNNSTSFAADVRLTARNPNKYLSLSFGKVDTVVYYGSRTNGSTEMPSFSLGKKSQVPLNASFGAVVVDEMGGRNYSFKLGLFSRVRDNEKSWRSRNNYLIVFCDGLVVGIPISNGTPGGLTGGPRPCRVQISGFRDERYFS